jgi:hypothetical protein
LSIYFFYNSSNFTPPNAPIYPIPDLQKKSSKKAVRRAALKPVQKRLIASDISGEAGFSVERHAEFCS